MLAVKRRVYQVPVRRFSLRRCIMSTLEMILTAAMIFPELGPEKVSMQVTTGESTPLDLRGEWRGTLYSPPDSIEPVAIENGYIFFISRDRFSCHLFECVQQSPGAFRGRWFGETCLGIYRYEERCIFLCLREASKGRPNSFRSINGQTLLILHRVKTGKQPPPRK